MMADRKVSSAAEAQSQIIRPQNCMVSWLKNEFITWTTILRPKGGISFLY